MKNLVMTKEKLNSSSSNIANRIEHYLTDHSEMKKIAKIMYPSFIGQAPGPITLIVDCALMDIIYPPETIFELRLDKERYLDYVAAGVCFSLHRNLMDPIKEAFPSFEWFVQSRLIALCADRIEKIARRCGVPASPDNSNPTDENLNNATAVVWLHEQIHWHNNGDSTHIENRLAAESLTQICLWNLLCREAGTLPLRSMMINLAAQQPECYRFF